MITTCTHCSASYRLDGAKVPPRKIRVRCPGCNGVFHLDGAAGSQESLANDPASGFVTGFQSTPSPSTDPGPPAPSEREIPPVVESPVQPPQPTVTAQPTPAAQSTPIDQPSTPTPAAQMDPPTAPVAPAATAPTAPAATPAAAPSATSPAAGRRRRSKEEMLARALVSDILVYNRDQRDTALAEGNLVETMGPEIKKSWELYKEKVTPEVANSNDYFREALNEILAEGSKVF